MLVLDGTADFSEVVELVLETMRPTFCVLFQTALCDLWVVGEITLDVVNLLVTHVLLLDVAEDIVVELCVKTEEHFRVVEVATLPHLLVHGLKQALVHAHFVNLKFQVGEDLQHESEFLL